MFHDVSNFILRGRRNACASFSEDELQFSWQESSIVILRCRRSTLDVSCCLFLANRIVRAASGGDNVQSTCLAGVACCDTR